MASREAYQQRIVTKSSADCCEPFRGCRFFLDAERVVEFVEEAAERNAQGQLDDLRFAEIAAHPLEERVGDVVRPFPSSDRVFDDELVSRVEFWVVPVI